MCVVIAGPVAELILYLWAIRTAVGDVCVPGYWSETGIS